MRKALEDEGLHVIMASSQARLSKYHMMSSEEKSAIFVVDQYDTLGDIMPIEQSTGIFRKYEETRSIERLYVAPENYTLARDLIFRKRL
jgi:hypothetical protein